MIPPETKKFYLNNLIEHHIIENIISTNSTIWCKSQMRHITKKYSIAVMKFIVVVNKWLTCIIYWRKWLASRVITFVKNIDLMTNNLEDSSPADEEVESWIKFHSWFFINGEIVLRLIRPDLAHHRWNLHLDLKLNQYSLCGVRFIEFISFCGQSCSCWCPGVTDTRASAAARSICSCNHSAASLMGISGTS